MRVGVETDVCVVGICGASADSTLCSAGLPVARTATIRAVAKRSTRMMSGNVVTYDCTTRLYNSDGSKLKGAVYQDCIRRSKSLRLMQVTQRGILPAVARLVFEAGTGAD
jgi:hypothetical protein